MNTAPPVDDVDDEYAELLRRARTATIGAGLSDGTDRPATTVEDAQR
jgi:hypothetical protein